MTWRFFIRQWQSGSFTTMFLAIVLALTTASCISFFSLRLAATLEYEAGEMLGADLILTANRPIAREIEQLARQYSSAVGQSVGGQMVLNKDAKFVTLVLNAVSPEFPLKGKHKIKLRGVEHEVDYSPSAGDVWLDSKIVEQLGLEIGEQVQIGGASLTYSAELIRETGSGFSLISLLPRALISLTDIEQTGLIQPGSRVNYKLAMRVRHDVDSLRHKLTPLLDASMSLADIKSSEPQIQESIQRANYFFGVTTGLSLILAIVALALAARRYLQRYTGQIAIMRAIGATSRQINQLFFKLFSGLTMVAALVGTVSGYGLHYLILYQAQKLLDVDYVQPAPWWLWFVLPLVAWVLVLVLVLPHIISLKHISAQRVLRGDLPLPKNQLSSAVSVIAIIIFASSLQIGDLKISCVFMASLLVIGLFIALLALVVIKLSKKIVVTTLVWQQALVNLTRRPGLTLMQIMTLSMCVLVLLSISLVKNDMLHAWQSKLPIDAPNYFMLGLQQGERADFLTAMQDITPQPPALYSMTLARLVQINHQDIDINQYQQRDKQLLQREFSLSWQASLVKHNAISSGKFWPPNSQRLEFSVEQGFAQRFNLQLGDELTFNIEGTSFSAPITSLRQVNWDDFKPNFFVIAPANFNHQLTLSYISSFYVPTNKKSQLKKVLTKLPQLSFIDVTNLLDTVKAIVNRLASTVNTLFILCLLAAAMVVWTSLLNAKDERLFDIALLRALGASNRLLRRSLLVELTIVGAIAGVTASILAIVLGAGITVMLLELPLQVNFYLVPLGIGLSILLALLNGYPVLRTVLNTSPRIILAES